MVRERDFSQQIRKLLGSLSSWDAVQHIVERVFQRIPSMASKMKENSEAVPKSRRKIQLISIFLDKLEELIDQPNQAKSLGLPLKIFDYLKYIDLLVTVNRSSQKTWKVYYLEKFSLNPSSELGLEAMVVEQRNKIKAWFKPKGLIGSVQAEADASKIWFSVSFTKQSKDRAKDRSRLQRSKFFYIVHYPGEPYFYSTGSKLPQELGEAVTQCFDSSAYVTIPLSGKYLDSLRELRLSRGVGMDPLVAVPGRERFNIFQQTSHNKRVFPKLDHVTIESNFEIGNLECLLENPEAMRGNVIKMRLECRGSDTIGGLNDLVSEDVVVRDPVPRWVSNLPTAGRNKLILVPNPRKETEWELQSIMSRTSNRSRFK